MRDKENRRDLVFFLHNRLHHFQLFNGIHIETLFVRVSCGKDYLDDILDKDLSSLYFSLLINVNLFLIIFDFIIWDFFYTYDSSIKKMISLTLGCFLH